MRVTAEKFGEINPFGTHAGDQNKVLLVGPPRSCGGTTALLQLARYCTELPAVDAVFTIDIARRAAAPPRLPSCSPASAARRLIDHRARRGDPQVDY
ncbi:hypothetical protein MRX96_059177 [Rhipicephalus microplus]